jgi:hypothetical protein
VHAKDRRRPGTDSVGWQVKFRWWCFGDARGSAVVTVNSSLATHAAGTPATTAPVIMSRASPGLITNCGLAGTSAAAHRCGLSAYERGNQTRRSISARPRAEA